MKPYYEHAGITIYHGDCREILPTLDPADHLISDPPYSAESHAMHDSGKAWAASQDGLDRKTLGFLSVDGPALAGTLKTAKVSRWAVFTMDERLTAWLRMNTPDGWRYVRTGIWVKPGSMPQFTGDRPAMGYEPVVVMHTTGGRTRWNGGGSAGVGPSPPVHGEHPTEKPLPLYCSLVNMFTDEGETILDPFMGSGTTLRAAKDLGRRAIGIEIEERYAEIAAKRMAQEVLPLK